MKNKNLVIFLTVFIICGSLFVYFIFFKNHSLSSDPSNWGQFSDYLNPFIALSNLIVFVWFSIEVFKYNQKKDEETDEFQKSIEKPVLVLKSTLNKDLGREVWEVHNIGKGAALNLKVAESNNREIGWITPVTKCYSLGSGDNLALAWFKYANVICITYEDVFNHRYVTIAADDESFIQPITAPFKGISISKKDFNLSDIHDYERLPTQRLAAALESASGAVAKNTTLP